MEEKEERKERGDKGRQGGTEGKRSDSLKSILYPRQQTAHVYFLIFPGGGFHFTTGRQGTRRGLMEHYLCLVDK